MAKRTDYTRAELREITPKDKLFAVAKGMGADVVKSKPREEIENAIIKRQRQLKKQAEREEAERTAQEEERFDGGEEASTEGEEGDDGGDDDGDEPDDMIDDDDDLDDGLDDEPDAPAPTMATATTVSAPREARLAKLREAQARKEAGGGALPGFSRGPAASRPASLVRSPKPRRRTPG